MKCAGRRFIMLLSTMAVLLPLSVHAFGPGLESYLRKSVMESSYIVVGRVVSTALFDEYSPKRQSTVVVDYPVYGESSKGDSLAVKWEANQWLVKGGGRAEVACGQSAALDTLAGKTVLWVFRNSGGITCAVPPIFVLEESSGRLNELIQAVEYPDTTNVVTAMIQNMCVELEADPESEVKRTRFVEYLRGVIESRNAE